MWNTRSSRSTLRSENSGNAIQSPGLVSEECFAQLLHLEQKRTERSGKSLVLMLLGLKNVASGKQARTIKQVQAVLSNSTRETDVKGWYMSQSILAIVFTEIEPADANTIAEALLTKIRGLLISAMPDRGNDIELSTWVFPEDWSKRGSDNDPGSAVPAELRRNLGQRKVALAAKRVMDVIGSLLAIAVFSPIFAAIALLIKLTSKGPILFRQQRVSQYGDTFEFLKFRSMYVCNDDAVHQEFVRKLIAGSVASGGEAGQEKPVYKLTNDPRITPIGRWIRRTSLDELPQFFNVLKGQMSLVGPRPPIPYEVDCYEPWHRRRLLAVKPGVTGLWQVMGRSRTTFDEMVRLDLQYARTWSIWMDVRILLQTPGAMVSGDGAH